MLNLTVNLFLVESPAVIDAAEGEMKLMSVKEGDPVILQTDVSQLTGDELIVWRFGDEGKLIAKHDLEAKNSSLYYDEEERFRDRLQLDQTGSLTIINTRTTDSGVYKVKISSKKQTLYKRFTVTVSGESLQSVLQCVSVFGYYKVFLKIAPWVCGDPTTLHPDTAIQKGDEIQWLFDDKEQTVLAEIKNTEVTKYNGIDWRFRDRLKLKKETGSLTITNFSAAHEGYYTLKITRGRDKIYKRFYVFVTGEEIAKMEGESVTLEPAREIKKDDLIQWLFGDREQQTVIAEIKGKTGKILTYADVADGRFRDRLELNKTTGSLTITNTRTEHAGVYKLEIISRNKVEETLLKEDSTVAVGDPVRLHTDLTEIQTEDEIQWRFGDENSLIAEIKGGTGETHVVPDERFRDRLELDEKTGDLTIKNSTYEHTGRYTLKISSSEGNTYRTYIVNIRGESLQSTGEMMLKIQLCLQENSSLCVKTIIDNLNGQYFTILQYSTVFVINKCSLGEHIINKS
uniref:Ig-like domain-containing protein n=1 Tax=Cyprinus carpio TaxID=7962 RepID=A0A8C1X3G3_CYPCA